MSETRRERLWFFVTKPWFSLRRRFIRLRGCHEFVCAGRKGKHRPCHRCGALTCGSHILVDPATLARRRHPTCGDCYPAASRMDTQTRRQRTDHDWSKLTDPVRNDLLVRDILPEQYAGTTRAAIRAFSMSDAESAVVPDRDAATLQASIHALGLGDTVYAEVRDGSAVLRRIDTMSPKAKR